MMQTLKGKSPAAFSGKLTCPHLIDVGGNLVVCGASSWGFVENISRYRIRYRCKACGKTIQYDFANNFQHPYAVFGKSKWQRLVELWKNKKGKRPLVVNT